MQFNKYYLAAAAAVLVIILFIVFSQRSDWDSNRYILSADDDGNLNPISESYFQNEEIKQRSAFEAMTQKLNKRVDDLRESLKYIVHVADYFGPHNGARCLHGSEGRNPQDCIRRGLCKDSIICPGNAVPVQTDGSGRERCRCATFRW